MARTIKMAGPFPICDTDDGKYFNGEYFTIPSPDVSGHLGTVKVRAKNGLFKETWIHPDSGVEGLARLLLWELWKDPDAPDVYGKK